jgi:hypothetical protein
MPQKEKDNKVLQSMRGKLVIWMSKKLTIVARILVANQVILASIWYVPSCADLSLSIVKTMKSLMKNFVWSGQANGKARAKVAWDIAILPLAKGGIKIIDPEAQTIVFLAKMLVRGLTLGPEPWKVLLCHWVHDLKQSYRRR